VYSSWRRLPSRRHHAGLGTSDFVLSCVVAEHVELWPAAVTEPSASEPRPVSASQPVELSSAALHFDVAKLPSLFLPEQYVSRSVGQLSVSSFYSVFASAPVAAVGEAPSAAAALQAVRLA